MASNEFEEVEVLRDPDGLACVITRRASTGHFSFALVKEYEKDGAILRTGFLNRRHVEAAKRLIDRAETWLDAQVDRAVASRARSR